MKVRQLESSSALCFILSAEVMIIWTLLHMIYVIWWKKYKIKNFIVESVAN